MADAKSKTAPTKDMLLCMAIIRNSIVSEINYAEVAKEIGSTTAHAAQCKWSNFRKLNGLSAGNARSTPIKGEASTKKAAGPKKSAKGKGQGNGEVKTTVKGTPKKRKMEEAEVHDEADDEDEDGGEEELVVETPVKKVKAANGKATANTPRKRVLKVGPVEDEDEVDSEEVETFSTVGPEPEEDSDDEA